jgi:WD40 repeat protein
MTHPQKTAPAGQHAMRLGITLAALLFASPLSAQEPKLRATFEGHTDDVRCVAISPDGKTLASGGIDNTIRFWDVASGKEQATLKNAAEYGVESVAFSPDGKTLASGIGGSGVKLWDIGTRKDTILRDKVSEYASPLVAFSPDGKTLASGGRCIREIRLWDVTTGKQTATLKGHDEYGVGVLAFTPDGKTLASVGGHDGALKLWDVATGENTATRKLADSTPAAAVSPDGKKVATAICIVESIKGENVITDNSVKLWDAAAGKQQATLKAADVSSMVFSPDGKTLVTGSEKGNIHLWDVATGKELATLKGHTDKVLSLAYSADGKVLASGSADKTIKLWDLAKPR